MSVQELHILALKAEWRRLETEAFGIGDIAKSARLRAEMSQIRERVRRLEGASGFSALSINSGFLR